MEYGKSPRGQIAAHVGISQGIMARQVQPWGCRWTAGSEGVYAGDTRATRFIDVNLMQEIKLAALQRK